MLIEGIAIGWVMVMAGVAMLLIEAYSPGFFIAVPGTVLIILGVLSLLFPEIFNSTWIVLIGTVVALVAAGMTIWLYSKITPDEAPVTISRDSLAGHEGRVIKEVNPDNINGKVELNGVEWSARSAEGLITQGTHVTVVRSEGVHIVVKEIE